MAALDPAAETLGDILGRALRGEAVPFDLPDASPEPYLWPVFNADGAVVDEREVSGEEWWRLMSSWGAARAFADHYDLSFEDVRHVMRSVPSNLAVLLDSPEGWTVMAEQVAITIMGELPGTPMLPAIH